VASRITNYINHHPIRTQRSLEIFTGLVPWLIIFFPVIGSFFIPEVVAYFILTFNVYWLYRSLQMTIFAISGYLNIKATEKVDWKEKLSVFAEKSKITNVVVICNYKESIEIVSRNVESLVCQNFPLKKMVVVVAMEEREGETARQRGNDLKNKYKDTFDHFEITYHPLTPEETIGKHSNESFAVRKIKNDFFKNEDFKNILITVCDADHVFPKQYFSLLTYKYLFESQPINHFYQAPQFFYNNLHRIPLLVRLPSIIGGIYMLSTLQKKSKRFMISAVYSMPLALLEKIGYWDLNYIPEDWHLFFKSYFKLGGKVDITPLYLPIMIDAAESNTKWGTYKNSYQQLKRWAWGSVDIPYVIKQSLLHPEIPFLDKLIRLSLSLEWHWTWSSSWFLITLGATIPTILNPVFARTTLGHNLSQISGSILTICLVGLFAIIFIDTLLNPQKKNKLATILHPFTYLQWVLLPIFGFFFGALPGLESQTRLMLGKYIDYRVTEKVTK
jgi:hypothetical protein